jgi:hypothetical protein
MLQVLAEFLDSTGAPVVNIDTAEIMAKGAGMTLVPGGEHDDEGYWEVFAPRSLVQAVDADELPIGVTVSFPNTDSLIGVVVVHPEPSVVAPYSLPLPAQPALMS